MAIKGGYKIINFKNINIKTGNSTTIKGIYELIEANYKKALMISGLMIDDIVQSDFFANYKVNNSNFEIAYNGGTLTVEQDDTVSYSV